MKNLHVILFALVALSASTLQAELRTANIFSDNMVLQQGKPVQVWGWTTPGESVTVKIKNRSVTGNADKNGKWLLSLPAIKSTSDAFQIVVTASGETKEFKNVVAGEVWICSGQSNMEWTVNNSANAAKEIATANFPNIRHVKVHNQTSNVPKEDAANTGWRVCSPETVGNFTAVGYFFARKLHKELDVPVGLINTSWGGTIIEAWIRGESLKEHPDFAGAVEQIESLPTDDASKRERQQAEQKWSAGFQAAMQDRSDKWEQTKLDDSAWKQIDAPGHWEGQGFPNLDGVAWYRRTIEIPADWEGLEMMLSLAQIDDADETYINGTKIGSTNQWNADREYVVDKDLVKAGPMTIAIRVSDGGMGGGIHGPEEAMFARAHAKEKISLAGKWKFKVGTKTETIGPRPQVAFSGPNNPTVLYNAMVNPLHPIGFKGVIWYQGESNAGRAYQYRDLMKMLVNDWRDQWKTDDAKNEFPFYWVQLANYMEPNDQPTVSNWAELREAQSMALSLPNTGQAVIIDIGEANDIHPKNKQDVGLRLALNALAKDYDKNVEFSGPVYRSMKIEGNKVRLAFDHAKGLQSKGGELKRFEIAGEDKNFVWADAKIEGDEVIVSSEKVAKPIAVRYAWSHNPKGCNLYNAADLPASPFRTDDWRISTQW